MLGDTLAGPRATQPELSTVWLGLPGRVTGLVFASVGRAGVPPLWAEPESLLRGPSRGPSSVWTHASRILELGLSKEKQSRRKQMFSLASLSSHLERDTLPVLSLHSTSASSSH